MKRRQFIQTASASALGAIASHRLFQTSSVAQAQTGNVSVQWYGHTCFLIQHNGVKILVNPYKSAGCTADYRGDFPTADIVLITSQLFDEGYIENLKGDPTVLWQAGQFEAEGIVFNGISLDHANAERYRGWRFPTNVAWSWTIGGIGFLHLGGAGEQVDIDDFILTGGAADVVMLPVGGTDAHVNSTPSFPPKGYLPTQAVKTLDLLQPKVIIPTHYLGTGADDTCRLNPVDDFLGLLGDDVTTKKLGTNRTQLSASSLSKDKTEVIVFNDSSL
ncbi:hypothetical protein Lepto7376_2573 [[Leptolyngbya] sp. PCC 7376]|uniref:MBL fold metallo-hydrolase n=1 Tax=[Leptolyngbya] sp. PCC 7376 TaxID=111781 RepID=UPI00029EE41B|nr:MBL fold metallo-hydrolase [[Leptolyngbya] sp. PCC 7376]AFY38846.1 hypothetical protein Lepto7376_2573 [[Leptolyngbya] sp. PCC 7376]